MDFELSQKLVEREVGPCLSYLIDNLVKLYWSEEINRAEASRCAYPKPKKPDIGFGEEEAIALYGDDKNEVFEHWQVSRYLAEKLIEQGEDVVEICNLWVWCRTTTGQMIAADEVIQRIANDKRLT